MPRNKPLAGERQIVTARRVQHHLNDALHVPVLRLQPSNVDSEPARNRGTDCVRVEPLTFDFAALEHVAGQRSQHGLLAELEPEAFHSADKPPLPVTDRGKRSS